MPLVAREDMPPPWFYGASALVAAESVFLPGNWGRVIRANVEMGNADPKDKLRYEEVFEAVRRAVASEAPSRLDCPFVSPNDAPHATSHGRNTLGRTPSIGLSRSPSLNAFSSAGRQGWFVYGGAASGIAGLLAESEGSGKVPRMRATLITA
jgi:hypothetical protein